MEQASAGPPLRDRSHIEDTLRLAAAEPSAELSGEAQQDISKLLTRDTWFQFLSFTCRVYGMRKDRPHSHQNMYAPKHSDTDTHACTEPLKPTSYNQKSDVQRYRRRAAHCFKCVSGLCCRYALEFSTEMRLSAECLQLLSRWKRKTDVFACE